MTSYTVSLEQMEFVRGEMVAITKQIQQTLESLDDGAKQNLAQWSSVAREAYDQAKAKWDAAAAKMQEQLGVASQSLGTIGEHYTSGEKYGVNLWDQ